MASGLVVVMDAVGMRGRRHFEPTATALRSLCLHCDGLHDCWRKVQVQVLCELQMITWKGQISMRALKCVTVEKNRVRGTGALAHAQTREHAAFNNLRTRNSVVGSSALKSSHSRFAFWPASARQTGPQTRTQISTHSPFIIHICHLFHTSTTYHSYLQGRFFSHQPCLPSARSHHSSSAVALFM